MSSDRICLEQLLIFPGVSVFCLCLSPHNNISCLLLLSPSPILSQTTWCRRRTNSPEQKASEPLEEEASSATHKKNTGRTPKKHNTHTHTLSLPLSLSLSLSLSKILSQHVSSSSVPNSAPAVVGLQAPFKIWFKNTKTKKHESYAYQSPSSSSTISFFGNPSSPRPVQRKPCEREEGRHSQTLVCSDETSKPWL